MTTFKPKLGMSEAEIIDLCRDSQLQRFFLPAPYWTAELYSQGRYFREYGFYPGFLPLCINTDHGVGGFKGPLDHDLNSDAPFQFYFSPRMIKTWKKISRKPCYPILSPAVYYRRSRNIVPSPNACGTIVFPVHGTPDCDVVFNEDAYIAQLKALPQEYQPVSVCLHYHDINKGLHHTYLKAGISVYTAGHTSDYRFIERFYDILKNFKFATSNGAGSFLFYAVEMGIPFFIYGQPQVFFNRNDNSIPLGKYDIYAISPRYKKIHALFYGLQKLNTPEQKKLVAEDLGITSTINRKTFLWLLYKAFFEWFFSIRSLRWLWQTCYFAFHRLLSLNKR